jgi:DNA-binding PadR family transcriptional regulator
MAPTQTDYIILAYLAEAPEHGYRLVERMKQDNLHLLIDFSVPNVYHALRRLHRNGAIRQEIRKTRGRPDQKIYSLTDRGREILSRFLEDDLLYNQQVRFRHDLIFLFKGKLEVEASETADAVRNRIDRLTADLEAVQAALRDSQTFGEGVSASGEIAFRHQIRFLKSEIDFYRKLLRQLG